jgi:hypothetical protein
MKQLIIDRSKWRTGGDDDGGEEHQTGEGYTRLINAQGYMCCLGFYLKDVAKLNKKILVELATPAYLDGLKKIYDKNDDVKLLLTKLNDSHYLNNDFCQSAMHVNDDVNLSSDEREETLKAMFLEKGVEVSFINEYHKPNNK